MSRKIAVVLFNLGGPDGPDAVRPFLFNLFNDPAIIGAPGLVRRAIAELISRTRTKSAQANYAHMGGGSPLLSETRAQAAALDAALRTANPGAEVRVVIAMRYWKPFKADAAAEIAAFGPDEIVLLPLYPQFSTTTTGSSLKAWHEAYSGPGRVRAVCCYPDAAGLVEAHARRIETTWEVAGRPRPMRLLFSAHGLPERVVAQGDPYRMQIERTCSAVAARLKAGGLGEGLDWRLCFQSRVGPLKWIGPSTPDEIRVAGAEGLPVLVSPIAFVSEHVETLVELDIEYRELAHQAGCPAYFRAPALGTELAFISALADAVARALGQETEVESLCGGRLCPTGFARCPAGAVAVREAA